MATTPEYRQIFIETCYRAWKKTPRQGKEPANPYMSVVPPGNLWNQKWCILTTTRPEPTTSSMVFSKAWQTTSQRKSRKYGCILCHGYQALDVKPVTVQPTSTLALGRFHRAKNCLFNSSQAKEFWKKRWGGGVTTSKSFGALFPQKVGKGTAYNVELCTNTVLKRKNLLCLER